MTTGLSEFQYEKRAAKSLTVHCNREDLHVEQVNEGC